MAASSAPPIGSVVRPILSADLDLPTEEAIRRAKANGVRASDDAIRAVVHNLRSKLKRGVLKPVPSTARAIAAPKPAPAAKPATATAATPAPKAAPAAAPAAVAEMASAPDVGRVLANVSLVNEVVGASGGVENARRVAEAVRACGGVEEFLTHLELVAGIRAAGQ